MKIKYFTETDTLYVASHPADIGEPRDLDAAGRICAITLEHASGRARISEFSYELVAA